MRGRKTECSSVHASDQERGGHTYTHTLSTPTQTHYTERQKEREITTNYLAVEEAGNDLLCHLVQEIQGVCLRALGLWAGAYAGVCWDGRGDGVGRLEKGFFGGRADNAKGCAVKVKS
jgi:hypothetical protein